MKVNRITHIHDKPYSNNNYKNDKRKDKTIKDFKEILENEVSKLKKY